MKVREWWPIPNCHHMVEKTPTTKKWKKKGTSTNNKSKKMIPLPPSMNYLYEDDYRYRPWRNELDEWYAWITMLILLLFLGSFLFYLSKNSRSLQLNTKYIPPLKQQQHNIMSEMNRFQ
jgi:cbb3-type cytochrome oxidase subunit 3